MDNNEEGDREVGDPLPHTQARQIEKDVIDERLRQLGPVNHQSGTVRSVYLQQFTILKEDDERRLKHRDDGEDDVIGYSHVCKHCHIVVTLRWKQKSSGRSGGSYHSVGAQRHLEKCAHGGMNAIAGAVAIKEEKAGVKHGLKIESIKAVHINNGFNELKKRKLAPFVAANQQVLPTASYKDTALCAQAHWFIYLSANPSFEVFRDNHFKTMLRAMIPNGRDPPILTIPNLKDFVAAE